jgi:hypothetical protein
LAKATPSKTSTEALVAHCHRWLLQRDPTGSIPRKQHLHAARREFGVAMTVRVFAQAYKRAYNKRRGRPLKGG